MSQTAQGQEPHDEFIVRRDGHRDLKFKGEKVAHVANRRQEAKRWIELALYRTATGDYVCHRAGISSVQGELPRNEAAVVPRDGLPGRPAHTIVTDFFGRDSLAKQIYLQAGIEDVERPTAVAAFITYARSVKLDDSVLDLSDRLWKRGIACAIDQHVTAPRGGWPQWMQDQVDQADFIIVVCDKEYGQYLKQQGAERGKGVRWEANLVMSRLYETEDRSAILVIVFDEEDADHIPTFLKSCTWFNVGGDDGFQKLCAHMLSVPSSAPRLPATDSAPLAKPRSGTEEPWCLVHAGPGFALIPFARLEDSGDVLTIELKPADTETSAWIGELRSKTRSGTAAGSASPLVVVYEKTTVMGELESLKRMASAEGDTWTMCLRYRHHNTGGRWMEMAFNGSAAGGRDYSADDIAELRARRILLNEDPPADPILEALVRGMNTPMQAKGSPIPELYRSFGDDRALFLAACRLHGTQVLHLTHVVEHVRKLDIAMSGDDEVSVDFEGVRAKAYANVPPSVIRVRGKCLLSVHGRKQGGIGGPGR